MQTRKYENEINKLQEEVKLSCTQLRVSYINCDAGALNILLKDDYHIVDNQIINWLYDKKYEHINYEKINKKFEHDKKDDIQGLEITFLSLESFGNRNIFNLRLEYDDIRYKKNTTIDWEAFKDINLKNKNIMSIERKLMKLGDRKVGEKLLIPLFFKYNIEGNHDIEWQKIVESDEIQEYQGEVYIYFPPDASYTYKNIYYPHQVLYYDDIINDEISVEIRDMLENRIKTSVYFSELG